MQTFKVGINLKKNSYVLWILKKQITIIKAEMYDVIDRTSSSTLYVRYCTYMCIPICCTLYASGNLEKDQSRTVVILYTNQ